MFIPWSILIRLSQRLLPLSYWLRWLLYVFVVLFYLLFSPIIAAMEAHSAGGIKGHAPILKETAKARLGIKINGLSIVDASQKLELLPSLTYGEFTALVPSFSEDDYHDEDGDEFDTVTHDAATLVWLDSNSKVIEGLTANTTLGCDAVSPKPSFVEVRLSNLQVKSKFGYPRVSEVISLWSKRFILSLDDGICYIVPNNLQVYSWQSMDFVNQVPPFKGFPPKAGFPTTAFKGAEFKLAMGYTHNNYDWVYPSFLVPVVSSSNGKGEVLQASGTTYSPTITSISFRFNQDNKPPAGSHTIIATNKITQKSYSYSFSLKPQRSWFVPLNLSGGSVPGNAESWQAANEACAPGQQLATGDAISKMQTMGGYARETGGLLNEWGAMFNYKSAEFMGHGRYWTSAPTGDGGYFRVDIYRGYISGEYEYSDSIYAMCVE